MSQVLRFNVNFYYPAALGFLGAIAVIAAGGGTWTTALWATVPTIAGIGLGWKMAVRNTALLASFDSYLAGQEKFSAEVVPVWTGHIESSREQMETAVAALSERFSGIVDKLDEAVHIEPGD